MKLSKAIFASQNSWSDGASGGRSQAQPGQQGNNGANSMILGAARHSQASKAIQALISAITFTFEINPIGEATKLY